MPKSWVNENIYKLQAEICKALGNPVRLQILHLLGDREVPFAELLDSLDVSKTNLSQHLAVLRKNQIVKDRKEGLRTFYRLAYPEIGTACRAVGEVLAKHLLEVEKQTKVLLRGVSRSKQGADAS